MDSLNSCFVVIFFVICLFLANTAHGGCPPVVLFGAGQNCPASECAVDADCPSGFNCCKVTEIACGGYRCIQPEIPDNNSQGSRVADLQIEIEGSDNTDCPDILCLEECDNGHRRDSVNCVTCECNPELPQRRNIQGCPIFTCDLYCGHRGYQLDSNGCKLCRCNSIWTPCPQVSCPRDEDCTAEFVNEGGCVKCRCKCPTFNPRIDCPKNCPTKIVEGKFGCESCVCDANSAPSTARQPSAQIGGSWPFTNPWQIQTNPFQTSWPFTSQITSPFVGNINVNPVNPSNNQNSNTNPFSPINPFQPNTNVNPVSSSTNSNTNPYFPFINQNNGNYNCPPSTCNTLNCLYGIVRETDANNCVRCYCSPSICQESGLICPAGTSCQVIAGTPRCVNINTQGVNNRCLSRPVCTIWCPDGYVMDGEGCATCQCQTTTTVTSSPRCPADSPRTDQCYIVRGNTNPTNPSRPTLPTNPSTPTWPIAVNSGCPQCSNQQQLRCSYGFLKDTRGCPICAARCAQRACDACYQGEMCLPGRPAIQITTRVSCFSLTTGRISQRQLTFVTTRFS